MSTVGRLSVDAAVREDDWELTGAWRRLAREVPIASRRRLVRSASFRRVGPSRPGVSCVGSESYRSDVCWKQFETVRRDMSVRWLYNKNAHWLLQA
ncbi:hypothetical protein ASPZODRAFT_137573 [Penicilliopsis zonata CBS 506.65]|uniref:Uncharacterized protein n=1 Tax=Penicilliopsis zonata CBS 506.65 TaxID=1073090 RepID=A0A1L9S4F4_9EURO|nr:hypothetical protein ASPZODRAFT_137573 [Penicilliopsis zonata CBS 506.65]OJJ42003.1 hypothetical protein ASPZODRAFT_137573 [Penicilliopsis zonata CBS 506.65]